MVEIRGGRITNRFVLGLIVLALGALWTLDNLGILDSGPILRWWPTLLVAFGVMKLFGLGTHRNVGAGGLIVVLGIWLLADGLGIGHVDLSVLWPLILVVIGLNLVMRSRRSYAPGDEGFTRIGTFSFFSGIDRKISSQAFQGGDVTAVMGGAKIDLREAKAAPEGAVLDLFVWWGGVELRVPEDWKVVLEGMVLMGGVEDRAKSPPADSKNTLFLRGVVIMGGVDIRN